MAVSRERGDTLVSTGVQLELERTRHAPAEARAAVAELARSLGIPRAIEQRLVLLVSEVVTNAVIHSKAPEEEPVTLCAEPGEGCVRVSVGDAGKGFVPRRRDPASIEQGYGLYLLEQAASRWGVERGARACVWFELDVPA